MPSSFDPVPAQPWWQNLYSTVQPVGWALRHAFPGRWVRIHSLTDSKRYAETEDDWAELRTRHRRAAALLFAPGDECYLIVPGCCASEECFDGSGLSPSLSLPEYRPDGDGPPNGPFHAAAMPWNFDLFLPVLKAVADDETRAIVVSSDAKQVYAPYDGGADLFFLNSAKWLQARRELAAYLSPREDGL